MDPISIVGMVSASVQFVDFGCKLLSKTYKIYHDARDASGGNDGLTVATANLVNLTGQLSKSLSSQRNHPSLEADEVALLETVRLCKSLGAELLAILESIRSKSGSRLWSSIQQAFHSVLKSSEIDQLSYRLDTLRSQLVLNFLVVMSSRGSQHLRQLEHVLNASQKALIGVVSEQKADFLSEIARLRQDLTQNRTNDASRTFRTFMVDHEASLSEVSTSVFNTVQNSSDVRTRKRILASLFSKETYERYHKIGEAHASTLVWAHKTQLDDTVRWDNFAIWLADPMPSQRMFWIAGKAGSGKSTLMRYLYDHHLTRQMLQSWCGTRVLLLASCYFWNAGTQLQRSQRGLLLALVDQLLSQHSDFTMSINPGRWRAYELGVVDPGEWAEWELRETLRNIVQEVTKDCRVCLFIDGLDEFEGNSEERMDMLNFLRELTHGSEVKLCVSGRPWSVFQDFFASTPQLLLEDLTRPDIEAYVRRELLENAAFAMFDTAKPRDCSALIKGVVAKASGVFLWVRLVVRNLLTALTEGDDLQDLRQILESIPADLNKFFRQMMTSINPLHLQQAGRMFDAACAAGEPLNLMTYCYLGLLTSSEVLSMDIRPTTPEQLAFCLDRTARQINSRTRGLLEVHYKQGETFFLSAEVDFLHRTVRDFLLTPETQHDIKQYDSDGGDVHNCLLRSFLVQLKTLDIDHLRSDFTDVCFLLQAAVRSAEKADDSVRHDVLQLMEGIYNVVSKYRTQYQGPQILSLRCPATEWWLTQREFSSLFVEWGFLARHFRGDRVQKRHVW